MDGLAEFGTHNGSVAYLRECLCRESTFTSSSSRSFAATASRCSASWRRTSTGFMSIYGRNMRITQLSREHGKPVLFGDMVIKFDG